MDVYYTELIQTLDAAYRRARTEVGIVLFGGEGNLPRNFLAPSRRVHYTGLLLAPQ